MIRAFESPQNEVKYAASQNYELKAREIFKMMGSYDKDAFELVASSILEAYHQWYEDAEEDWVLSLFFPEHRQPCRIQGVVPIPTHIFTERVTINLTANATNTGGNFWVQFVPQTHQDADAYKPMCTQVGAANTIDKFGASWKIKPDTYFKSYRLTSAAMIVTYTGSIEKAKGKIYAAMDFDTDNDLTQIIDENDFQNKYYCDHNTVLKGQKIIWLPKDYNDLDFRGASSTLGGTCISARISGVPVDEGSVVRVDFYRTVEGIPKPDYYQLLSPVSAVSSKQPQELFTDIQRVVQSQPPTMVPQSKDEAKRISSGSILKSMGSSLLNSAGEFIVQQAPNAMAKAAGVIGRLVTSLFI